MIIKIIIKIIKLYQIAFSQLLGKNCRFHPSCSTYTIKALKIHGFFKGSFLSIKRILKCHPFHKGGYDPVPNDPEE